MRPVILSGIIFWSLFLVPFTSTLHQVYGLEMEMGMKMVPVIEEGKMISMMFNESRRKLDSFQMCALCTCCGGENKNYCLPSPCCYAIACNIPNRPYGFCAFIPKTCNCFGCHI